MKQLAGRIEKQERKELGTLPDFGKDEGEPIRILELKDNPVIVLAIS